MSPDSLHLAQQPVTVTQCDGYVVVSFWQPKSGSAEGDYHYEHCSTLNDALDVYAEYDHGGWARARGLGIFAAKNGLPIGGRMDPAQLMRLMRETRRA